MIRSILVAGLAVFAMGTPALAQEYAASVEFNLLTFEGAYLSKVFTFDAAYTENYGIPVSVPFRIAVPTRTGVDLIADGRPNGGLVKFTFATDEGEARQFIENFHVITASFPIPTDHEDPVGERIRVVAGLLAEQAFPAAVQGFGDPKILALGPISIGETDAVELVGQYGDPSLGPMLVRIVAFPHPTRAESYFVINNINRTLVPATNNEDLANSLGGRTFQSFTYLE